MMGNKQGSSLADQLACCICMENYDDGDHLPKTLPCQHNLCVTCLGNIIRERREHGEGDIECPLCRQAIPIPMSGAVGFPTNPILEGLMSTSRRVPVYIPCAGCPNTTARAFCVTCSEALCSTCREKLHEGHRVEDLTHGMGELKGKAQKQLDEVIRTCSAIHEKFKEEASANNPECFRYLTQLQRCSDEVRACTDTAAGATGGDRVKQVSPPRPSAGDMDQATGIAHTKSTETCTPKPHSNSNRHLPDTKSCGSKAEEDTQHGPCTPYQQAMNTGPHEVLRPVSPLPRHEDKHIVEFQLAVKLPNLRHIDLNRSNSLLTVSVQGNHALHKLSPPTNKFLSLAQASLSDDGLRMLAQANYIVLSHDDEMAIPGQFKMIHSNESFSFCGRLYSKVKIMHGNWFVTTNQLHDEIKVELFTVTRGETIPTGCEVLHTTSLSANLLVVPTRGCYGVAVVDIGATSTIKIIDILGPSMHTAHNKPCGMINSAMCVSTGSPKKVKLVPRPGNVISAAVLKNVAMLLEDDGRKSTVAVYVLRNHDKVWNYTTRLWDDVSNRKCELSARGLGLGQDCRLKKIWAGDREDGRSLLHVLYASPTDAVPALATYTVSDTILNL